MTYKIENHYEETDRFHGRNVYHIKKDGILVGVAYSPELIIDLLQGRQSSQTVSSVVNSQFGDH